VLLDLVVVALTFLVVVAVVLVELDCQDFKLVLEAKH
jgi:hypothetical protein